MDTHKKKESQEAARKRKYWGGAECLFPEAAITKCHRQCDSTNRKLFSYNSRGWKSELKVSEGLGSSEFSHWLADGHLLHVSSWGLPSEGVCVLISSSHKDTSYIVLGSSLMTSF